MLALKEVKIVKLAVVLIVIPNYRLPIATIVLIHQTLSAVYLSNHYQANCAKNMSTNVSHLLIRSVCRKAA